MKLFFRKNSLLLLPLLLSANFSFSQFHQKPSDSLPENFVIIQNITLEGNHRTRDQIIMRELTFSSGDTIRGDDVMKELEQSRNQVMNTGLFNEVVVNIRRWVNDSMDIYVSVKERWYFLPLPTANLYDRNFNVWWVEHDHDIRWMQAGIRFYQKNLTGRNDELKGTILFGFQRRLDGTYTLPYFDYIQKHGMSVSASLTQSKNVTSKVDSNKEVVIQDVDSYLRSVFETSVNFFYKPKFHYRYTLTLGYKNSYIQDTIAHSNPDYFLSGNTRQRYLYATLTFVTDFRDLNAYPLRGYYFNASISKLGLGLFEDVDLWQTNAAFSLYLPLGKKWYVASVNKVKVTFPERQPYNLQRGLGYGNDYVAGYEYYVMDGQGFGYTKLNLKKEIFKVQMKTGANNPFVKGANITFALYGKVYGDAGYVYNTNSSIDNALDNRWLLGSGIGIDLVLLYDTTIRLEYSINKLGERGLFFHGDTYF